MRGYFDRKPERIKETIMRLTERHDFMDAVKILRSKWAPKDIKQLLRKFHLRQSYDTLIERLLKNESLEGIDPEAPYLEVDIQKDMDEVTGDFLFKLVIFPSTNKDDLPWRAIKNMMQQSGRKRIKLWKTFERDKFIYEMALSGKDTLEISGLLNSKFHIDMDYGAIKKALSQFQYKMKIPKELRAHLVTHKR